jgi:hypothetical protein
MQIDQILNAYDERARKKAEKDSMIMETRRDLFSSSLNETSLRFLFEQEDEDPFAAEAEDEPADEPAAEEDTGAEGGDAGGGEGGAEPEGEDVPSAADTKTTESAPLPEVPMDVSKFANDVGRLVKNPENLLSLQPVIINRAINLIKENYPENADKYVERFKQFMEEQGFKIEQYPRVSEPDDEPEVFGLGANPAGAGIGG